MVKTVEKVYTPAEAAEILKVSELTLLDWLRAGKIRGVKVGRLWRVRESDIDEFLSANQTQLKKKGGDKSGK